MKKILFFVLIFFSTNFAIKAQELRHVGEVNTENYPETSFTINLFNPDAKPKTWFEISEKGNIIEPTKFEMIPNTSSGSQKTVLILWEDMADAYHPYQTEFFRKMLINSLQDIVKTGDRVNIVVFDRKRNSENILENYLLNNFTDNADELIAKVKTHDSKNDMYTYNQSSELYGAVREGLLKLKATSGSSNKILVVLSAGKNLDVSSEKTQDNCSKLANESRIPIYSIQYNMQGWEHNNLSQMVSASYGREYLTKLALPFEQRLQEATDTFKVYMSKAVSRLEGTTYRITYNTSFSKRDKNPAVDVYANNKGDHLNISFNLPSYTIFDWFLDNIIVALLILIILVGGAVFIVLRANQKAKKQIELEKRNREQLEKANKKADSLKQDMEQQKELIEEQNRKIDEERFRQDEAIRQRAAEEEQKRQQEKMLELWNKKVDEMQRFRAPKLVYSIDNKQYTFEVSQPEVKIGRDSNNDLAIPDKTISGKHFVIRYEFGGKFIAKNLSTSNYTYINDNRIDEHLLKNGDVIKTGNIRLQFFF